MEGNKEKTMGGIDTTKPKESLEALKAKWEEISNADTGVCRDVVNQPTSSGVTDTNCERPLNELAGSVRNFSNELDALVKGKYKVDGEKAVQVTRLEEACPELAGFNPKTLTVKEAYTQGLAKGQACIETIDANLYANKADAEAAAVPITGRTSGDEAVAAAPPPPRPKPETLQQVPDITPLTLWTELYTTLSRHFGEAVINLGEAPEVWKSYGTSLVKLKGDAAFAVKTEEEKTRTGANLVGALPADLIALINGLPDGDEKAFYETVVKPRVQEWMDTNIDNLTGHPDLLAAKYRFEKCSDAAGCKENYAALIQAVSERVLGKASEDVAGLKYDTTSLREEKELPPEWDGKELPLANAAKLAGYFSHQARRQGKTVDGILSDMGYKSPARKDKEGEALPMSEAEMLAAVREISGLKPEEAEDKYGDLTTNASKWAGGKKGNISGTLMGKFWSVEGEGNYSYVVLGGVEASYPLGKDFTVAFQANLVAYKSTALMLDPYGDLFGASGPAGAFSLNDISLAVQYAIGDTGIVEIRAGLIDGDLGQTPRDGYGKGFNQVGVLKYPTHWYPTGGGVKGFANNKFKINKAFVNPFLDVGYYFETIEPALATGDTTPDREKVLNLVVGVEAGGDLGSGNELSGIAHFQYGQGDIKAGSETFKAKVPLIGGGLKFDQSNGNKQQGFTVSALVERTLNAESPKDGTEKVDSLLMVRGEASYTIPLKNSGVRIVPKVAGGYASRSSSLFLLDSETTMSSGDAPTGYDGTTISFAAGLGVKDIPVGAAKLSLDGGALYMKIERGDQSEGGWGGGGSAVLSF